MSLIFLGTTIIIIGIIQKILEEPKEKCNCSYAHKENGLNYSWLNKEFGDVLKIEFEEPVEQNNLDNGRPIFRNGEMIGKWKSYTDKIWDIHCKPDVIDHSPDKLVDQHMTAFVNPETRFARLRFTLRKNGKLYQTEPTRRFYELERNFFSKCK